MLLGGLQGLPEIRHTSGVAAVGSSLIEAHATLCFATSGVAFPEFIPCTPLRSRHGGRAGRRGELGPNSSRTGSSDVACPLTHP